MISFGTIQDQSGKNMNCGLIFFIFDNVRLSLPFTNMKFLYFFFNFLKTFNEYFLWAQYT